MEESMKGNIAEGLRSLAYPVEKLKFDPKNARRHSERNLSMISDSLKAFGQRRPIVVNGITNIVIAGNGVLTAATRLGWDEIAVLFVEDDDATAAGYALADNRTGDTSSWDKETLKELVGLLESKEPELLVGWSEAELNELMDRKVSELDEGEAEGAEALGEGQGAGVGSDELEESELDESRVRTFTLYIPSDEYEVVLSDMERVMKAYNLPDLTSAVIKALEVSSRP